MARKAPMTAAGARALAEKMLGAWNTHDVTAVLRLLTDDVVWSDPSLPEPAHGKVAVAAHLRDTFTAFPDLHFPVEDFHVFTSMRDQAAATSWTMTATMTGPLASGVPATGRHVRVDGTNVSRLRDGLIFDYTTHYDQLDLLQQIGVMPRTDGLAFQALVLAEVAGMRARSLLRV